MFNTSAPYACVSGARTWLPPDTAFPFPACVAPWHGWSKMEPRMVIGQSFLVGGIPTPLKNMSSSAGMIITNWMESHKIPWFQTTNQILFWFPYTVVGFQGWSPRETGEVWYPGGAMWARGITGGSVLKGPQIPASQWEFRDPKMEVRKPIICQAIFCGDIPWNLGLNYIW